MDEPLSAVSQPVGTAPEDRLDSWKEIAAYLKRDVTTVQRWEKREGMPVHRHLHDKMGSVYASRRELDAWAQSRRAALAAQPAEVEAVEVPEAPARELTAPARADRRFRAGVWIAVAAAVLVGALLVWQLQRRVGTQPNPLA